MASPCTSAGSPEKDCTSTDRQVNSMASCDSITHCPNVKKAKRASRRAAQACISCRARKVRCDVVHGAPCRNCSWDQVECVVQARRPRRPTRSSITIEHVARSEITRSSCASISSPRPEVAAHAKVASPKSPTQETSSASYVELLSMIADLVKEPSLKQAATPIVAARHVHLDLPSHIAQPPLTISDAVVRFLQDTGAFDLPCLSTQKLLLEAFFDFVQPALPVTSYRQYEDVFDVQHGGISLLLYVAMLFAGSLYADQVQLSLDGYTDRWELMQDLFEKAKNLYNMDYEQDRLALVQCSLLMSLWSERTLSNQQSSFYWMNIAISIAHDMNLHTEASSRGLEARASQLRRKLWWCCVMRDSLIALGRCSAPQIRDHDVPMLQVADFADAETSRVLLSPIAAAQAKTLAELCVQRAKLSLHLNRALRLRYSQHHSDPRPVVEGSSKLIRQDYIHTTNRALAAWHKALPLACRYQALPVLAVAQPLEVASKTTAAAGADIVLVLRSFLHMQYHATISTLNRPFSILSCCSSKKSSQANTPHACENTPSELANRKRTQDSANHVIQVAAELHRHRLDKFLPTTSTAMIVQALLVHTMQSAALQNGADYRPNRDVLQAIRVLDEMRQRSVFSHVAARYLESGMERPGASSGENGVKPGVHAKMDLSQTNIKASMNPSTPPSTIQPLASPQWSDYQQTPAVESSKLPATSVLTPASVLIGQDQHNYNRTESVNSGTSMTSVEHQVSAVPDLFSPSIFDWDLDLDGIDPAWMETSEDYLHGGDDGVTARLVDHLGMHDEQLGLPMFNIEALDSLIIM